MASLSDANSMLIPSTECERQIQITGQLEQRRRYSTYLLTLYFTGLAWCKLQLEDDCRRLLPCNYTYRRSVDRRDGRGIIKNNIFRVYNENDAIFPVFSFCFVLIMRSVSVPQSTHKRGYLLMWVRRAHRRRGRANKRRGG